MSRKEPPGGSEPEPLDLPIPAELTRRARSIAESEDAQWIPVPARDAATVVLLRGTRSGFEVFLQRRVGTMAFAAGMYVFPGGRVEDRDADPSVPWIGDRQFEPFKLRPECAPTASFRAMTVAAARETWEEAGVSLATASSRRVRPPDTSQDLLGWLAEVGATITATDLHPWAHWVTPEAERRRFDTRFLVAALPEEQQATERGSESDDSTWIDPGSALTKAGAGELPMLPPTLRSLQLLTEFADVSSVLRHARELRPTPLLPKPELTKTGEVRWVIVDAYSQEPIWP
ncbi:MAG: NUDIX hydrolase [Candidatus Nanopelagicales bacterium]|nr:NUDIX hydrolase [Candidatus Nanopelagicales bacterium]MDZ4248670.1 NUDIX hydrolase [Candidatus Nanopelagicales bacterium]